jgi:hypothetical protein
MLSAPNILNKIFIALFFALAAILPVVAQSEAQQSAIVNLPVPTAAAPIWGKLVISGNTVTCYYAKGTAKPTTWTQLGSPETIGFVNDPILVGIYLTAHDNGAAATISNGTIDNFSITPTPTYRLADTDPGAPTLMGSANLINGVWNLSASGNDVWGSYDQCNFQSWLVWGDATVICRVTSLTTSGSPWEKIGIMVRDGFNSGSDYAAFCASNGAGVAYQYRPEFDDNNDITEFVAPPLPGVKSSVAVGYGLTGGTSYTLRP